MHEAGIARRILEAARERAATEDRGELTGVEVELGDAAGVSAESLAFHWQLLTDGSDAEGIMLHIARSEDPTAFSIVSIDVDDRRRKGECRS